MLINLTIRVKEKGIKEKKMCNLNVFNMFRCDKCFIKERRNEI